MINKFFSFFLFFFLFFLSCNSDLNNDRLVINSGETQGTFYHIKYLNNQGLDLHAEIDSILLLVDNSLSTYNKESLISNINLNKRNTTDSLFRTVFRKAKEIHQNTLGYFDCSVAPIVNAWGFGFSKKEKMDSSKVTSLLKNVGFEKITLLNDTILKPKKMLIDFNSIAQGYTVDLIAEFFNQKEIKDYLIEIGGEIRSKGKNANNKIWTVGVDKPNEQINSNDRFEFILKLED